MGRKLMRIKVEEINREREKAACGVVGVNRGVDVRLIEVARDLRDR